MMQNLFSICTHCLLYDYVKLVVEKEADLSSRKDNRGDDGGRRAKSGNHKKEIVILFCIIEQSIESIQV